MAEPVIVPPSISDAERLRKFFSDEGYTGTNICKVLGITQLPSPRRRSVVQMPDVAEAPTPLSLLLHLFYAGLPADRSLATRGLPPWLIDLACTCRLLRADGNQLVPEAIFTPADDLWIAADLNSRFEAGAPDFVLWPNATTRFLSGFTIRRRSGSTLDLGTGNGILALQAASHSDQVIATDLNPRALDFGAFNARFNGFENVEFLCGDGFVPVKGRKFDLIVSNPPFFIVPTETFLFCHNTMDLDGLCRQFTRDAAKYLNEGGYFQMLCEWAELEGEPWQDRVREWFNGLGCDAWVVKAQTRTPAEYSMDRIAELGAHGTFDADVYSQYRAYYHKQNVAAIHNGLIAMRRRSGENWVLIEENTHVPEQAFGDIVLNRFTASDFLHANAARAQILAIKPSLCPDARIEQLFHPANGGGWKTLSTTLKLARGFAFSLGVQPLVAEFLNACDGRHTLGELIRDFSARVNGQPEQVEKECIEVVCTLISHGYVRWQ